MLPRIFAASLALASLGIVAAPAPAPASSSRLTLTVDGRPLSPGAATVLRRGNGDFVSLAEINRVFGGLLTYSKRGAAVTIDQTTADFVVGSKVADINEAPAKMNAAPLREGGELYVPLAFFVKRVAHAGVRIDAAAKTADIIAAS